MIKPLNLPLTKVNNARDLGAYEGIDGRKIKSHRLLRTGKLVNMTPEDEEYLVNYGLNKIVDLRTPSEIRTAPDKVPVNVEHFDMSVHEDEKVGVPDEKRAALRKMYDKDQSAGFKGMCHQYEITVNSAHSQKAYHDLLELLANNETGATIYHCSEGKDRTGFASLYIMHILGVDLTVIREDYLYSNYALTDYRARLDKKIIKEGGNDILRACMRSLGSVANEYLDTALLLIDKEYGGLDEYLKNQIGVTPDMVEQLRNLYLEPKKA